MLTSSYVFLKGLRFHSYHGVLEQERVVGNDYLVDVRLAVRIDKAMESDRLEDTINYAEIHHLIKKEMVQPSQLIEHVAGRISQRLFDRYAVVTGVDLRITKLNPPMGADCEGAGVEVHLTRETPANSSCC
jgi:dihydroneopterin aldolase